jgi:ketol-acid reductoisomerase
MSVWRSEELLVPPLLNRRVAILGYGSQGRAQALNLRDSGVDVVVGLRENSPSRKKAQADLLSVEVLEDAVASADLVAMLVPESAHEALLSETIFPIAKPGAAIVFAHGFTPLYTTLSFRSDLQRLLVAPKAIGPELRRLYVEGKGAPALISAEPGDVELAKSYAFALGCGRAVVLASSFREETEADLFSEQAVLCGGLPALIVAAFDTLVESGYSEEAAYFECLFEVRLIAEMMVQHGIAGMAERISDTARFGAARAGGQLVDERTREKMRKLLEQIRDGQFARDFRQEQESGMAESVRWLENLRLSRIQASHRKVAEWIGSPAASAAATESAAGESSTPRKA